MGDKRRRPSCRRIRYRLNYRPRSIPNLACRFSVPLSPSRSEWTAQRRGGYAINSDGLLTITRVRARALDRVKKNPKSTRRYGSISKNVEDFYRFRVCVYFFGRKVSYDKLISTETYLAKKLSCVNIDDMLIYWRIRLISRQSRIAFPTDSASHF